MADFTREQLHWQCVTPNKPLYLFASQAEGRRAEYDAGWSLTSICPVNVLGFQTHRDDFAISFTAAEMQDKLNELKNPDVRDDEFASRYGLSDSGSWSLSDARLTAKKGNVGRLQPVAYRPFDVRWSEYTVLTVDRPRRELLQHVAGRKNICLNVVRRTKAQHWQHALVSDKPTPAVFIEIKDGSSVFPMRLFVNQDDNGTEEVRENLSPEFRAFLDDRFGHQYETEEVFAYIYAILHAPTYRTGYAEFLKIDFPRVAFPAQRQMFESLSELGRGLIEAHLLKELPQRNLAQYRGKGDHAVEAVRYSPVEQAVWINKEQRFQPVPQEVWDFHIGGYQVLEKYLKSRKGRKLSLDEINHLALVADTLAFTIEQMARIDEAYRAAFPGGG